MVECESKNEVNEYLTLDEIGHTDGTTWIEKEKIIDLKTDVKIDTRAEFNVIPIKYFEFLGVKLNNSKIVIKVFGGALIKSIGTEK